MKIFLISILLVLMSFCARATVRTVSINPGAGAQYSSLWSAYMASSNGDTLLLDPSNGTYGLSNGQLWAKSLTVIGGGLQPVKENSLPTNMAYTGTGNNYFVMKDTASGSKFYGITFYSILNPTTTLSNLLFESCMFMSPLITGGTSISNFLFKNCIFSAQPRSASFRLPSVGNMTFRNCIFSGELEGNADVSGAVFSGEINHCIFLHTLNGTNGTSVVFQNLSGMMIKNSIFYNVTQSVGGAGNVFTNCAVKASIPLPPSGNTGSGNFTGTDPAFVSVPASNPVFSFSNNYRLSGNSQLRNKGDDGTDLGVFGGNSGFDESGEVLITNTIRSIILQNPTVAPGGTLNVKLRAGKPRNN